MPLGVHRGVEHGLAATGIASTPAAGHMVVAPAIRVTGLYYRNAASTPSFLLLVVLPEQQYTAIRVAPTLPLSLVYIHRSNSPALDPYHRKRKQLSSCQNGRRICAGHWVRSNQWP